MAKYPNGVAIEELVGTKPYLYAFDVRAKKFVLARASSVHQSGSQVPVYKITFKPWRQNMRKVGLPTSIIATGDHKFFLRASPGQNYQATVFNGYKKLKDLKPGDRLLPLCRELSRYSKLVNVLDGSMEQEHRLILRFLYGNRGMEFHGHHKNGEKFDNRIKNLEWKKQGEHLSYHAKEANGNGGYLGWQNHSGIHPRGMLGKKQSARHADAMKEYSARNWKEKSKVDPWRRKDVLVDLYYVQGLSSRKIAEMYGVSQPSILTALRRNGLEVANNHEVQKIEFVGYRNVYDITVPKYHNFVANGVVVHNSGKTMMALRLAGLAQKDGAKVGWVDVENSFDADWARLQGLEPGEPVYDDEGKIRGDSDIYLFNTKFGSFKRKEKKKPVFGKKEPKKKKDPEEEQAKLRLSERQQSAEELLTLVEKWLILQRKLSPDGKVFLGLDSTTALQPEEELEAGYMDQNMRTRMSLAPLLNTLSKRMIPIASNTNALIVFICQLRTNPTASMFECPEYTPGGNGILFYPSVVAWMKRVRNVYEKGKNVGLESIIENRKNKMGYGSVEKEKIGVKMKFQSSDWAFVESDELFKKKS